MYYSDYCNNYYEEEDEVVCDYCEEVYDTEDRLAIIERADLHKDGRVHGMCKACARELSKEFGLRISDESAKMYSDEYDKIMNSVIPLLYTYEELMKMVRTDIENRLKSGNTADIKRINKVLYDFCLYDDSFFTECLEKFFKES